MPDSFTESHEFHVTTADGVDIGCYVEGSGPPLLMVHGVAIDHSCFDRARPLLAKHFTLYLMDRRGRGLSGDADAWELAREFDDVRAVIDAIPGPVNVFGHSLGGLCVLEAAVRTNNVRRIFLYDPAIPSGPRPPRLTEVADKLDGILRETGDREKMIETHLLEWTRISPQALARQKADAARWRRRLGWAHTIPREYKGTQIFKADWSRYGAIDVPIRVMIGEKSHDGLKNSTRKLTETIPGSEMMVFSGAAHYGFTTAPETFATEVVRFFKHEDANG